MTSRYHFERARRLGVRLSAAKLELWHVRACGVHLADSTVLARDTGAAILRAWTAISGELGMVRLGGRSKSPFTRAADLPRGRIDGSGCRRSSAVMPMRATSCETPGGYIVLILRASPPHTELAGKYPDGPVDCQ